MFRTIINAVFDGCATDMERLFAILLFVLLIAMVEEIICAVVGGVRR